VSDATESALEQLGFSYVSTSVSLEHTSRWELIDIPGTCYWSARSGVLAGLDHLGLSPIVVFTGHFYDFHHPSGDLKRDALDKFDRTLSWLRDLEHVRVVDMDDVASACARDWRTWKRITRCRAAFDLPYQVRRAVKWPTWLPTTGVSSALRRIQLLGFGIWSGIVLTFFLGGWAVGWTGLVPLASSSALVLAVLGGIMVVVAARRGFARQLTRAALLAVAGCVLGLSSSGCPYR
jgi:hypothetical protein